MSGFLDWDTADAAARAKWHPVTQMPGRFPRFTVVIGKFVLQVDWS